MSTLDRKAWGDLTQHRARTLLAAFSLCIATATLGFVAVPSLLNATMERQVQQSHLYDVGMSIRILNLTPAQLGALGRLPGITAVSADLGYVTQAKSGAGTQNVAIAGGALAAAPVDTVPLLTGRLPGPARCWPTRPTAHPPTTPCPPARRCGSGRPAARWCRCGSAVPG